VKGDVIYVVKHLLKEEEEEEEEVRRRLRIGIPNTNGFPPLSKGNLGTRYHQRTKSFPEGHKHGNRELKVYNRDDSL
jgi:hypothetical protein